MKNLNAHMARFQIYPTFTYWFCVSCKHPTAKWKNGKLGKKFYLFECEKWCCIPFQPQTKQGNNEDKCIKDTNNHLKVNKDCT